MIFLYLLKIMFFMFYQFISFESDISHICPVILKMWLKPYPNATYPIRSLK